MSATICISGEPRAQAFSTINAEGKEESFRRVAELSKECGAVRMEFSKSEDDSYAAFCAYVCNERRDKYRQDAYDVELIVMDEENRLQEVISNMPDIGMLNFAQMLFAEERLYVLGYQYYSEGRKKSKKNPLIEQKDSCCSVSKRPIGERLSRGQFGPICR